MNPSRTFAKAISRMLIGVLLFAQFAVASYACPGLKEMVLVANASAGTDSTAKLTTQTAAMPPGCEEMDAELPNLCVEHCRQGQQSADTAAAPTVGPGIPVLLYSLPLEPQHSLGSGRALPAHARAHARDGRLDPAPEPPHAILHCVFRL